MIPSPRSILKSTLPAAAAAALLLPALSAAPAAAQVWAGKSRIQGQVKDEAGKPIEGAEVRLYFEETEEGPEAIFTNKKGRWSYLGLAGASWKVVIEKEGYIPSEGPVKVASFGTGPNVPTTLRQITEEMKAGQKAEEISSWIERGNALLGEGSYAAARAEYERAEAELDTPRKPPILRAIARTYYEEQQLPEAIEHLERALEIDADDVDSLQLIIHLLGASGRDSEIATYAARLPEGETLDLSSILNMGIDLYNKSDLAGAIEHFEQAVADHPDSADAYYYRATVYMSQGKNAEASADFTKVLELAPEHPKAGEVREFLKYLEGS